MWFTDDVLMPRTKKPELMEFIEPTAITDELYAAISQMAKQLTSNAPSLTREELTNLIKSDSTSLLLLEMNEKL